MCSTNHSPQIRFQMFFFFIIITIIDLIIQCWNFKSNISASEKWQRIRAEAQVASGAVRRIPQGTISEFIIHILKN